MKREDRQRYVQEKNFVIVHSDCFSNPKRKIDGSQAERICPYELPASSEAYSTKKCNDPDRTAQQIEKLMESCRSSKTVRA